MKKGAARPKRALTVQNVLAKTSVKINFTGRFLEVFGNPQNKGRWFVWGGSGSGKSSFVMQLAKEFAKTQKTLYVFKEEDLDDDNVQDRLRIHQLHDVKQNFSICEDNLDELTRRLEMRDSAQVIFIDSAMYFFRGYSFDDYIAFTRKFSKKLFVFTAHAKGSQPRTEFEVSINFDATQKVYVNGYVASNKGRKFGTGGSQFIIWQKGYDDLNGINTNELTQEEDEYQ